MRRAGFYREMQIAGDEHPSLHEALGTLPGDADKERIVRYLADGRGVIMAPAMVDDALDPQRQAVAELGLLTDGEWLWPAELEYYVEHYDVGVPDRFLEHMVSNRWAVPSLTGEELSRIAEEVAPAD